MSCNFGGKLGRRKAKGDIEAEVGAMGVTDSSEHNLADDEDTQEWSRRRDSAAVGLAVHG